MLYYSIILLYYITLYCIILYYMILYYIMLYYIILYYMRVLVCIYVLCAKIGVIGYTSPLPFSKKRPSRPWSSNCPQWEVRDAVRFFGIDGFTISRTVETSKSCGISWGCRDV